MNTWKSVKLNSNKLNSAMNGLVDNFGVYLVDYRSIPDSEVPAFETMIERGDVKALEQYGELVWTGSNLDDAWDEADGYGMDADDPTPYIYDAEMGQIYS